MVIDVNAWIGRYPFRRIGAGPAELEAEMAGQKIDVAWVSHLSAAFWKDPTAGNPQLYRIAEEHPSLRPVPAIHPGLPGWRAELEAARARGAPAVRADPTVYGIAPQGAEMRALVEESARVGLPLVLAVKLEDVRQRHPNDVAPELTAAAVRWVVRTAPAARFIVTAADRDFIEQVHYGATAGEAARILWDIGWIWGPPENHLTHLVETIGAERFCFGTGMPLRIPENSVAKLDLARFAPDVRARIESGNVASWT